VLFLILFLVSLLGNGAWLFCRVLPRVRTVSAPKTPPSLYEHWRARLEQVNSSYGSGKVSVDIKDLSQARKHGTDELFFGNGLTGYSGTFFVRWDWVNDHKEVAYYMQAVEDYVASGKKYDLGRVAHFAQPLFESYDNAITKKSLMRKLDTSTLRMV
jgi:hypothetical protein